MGDSVSTVGREQLLRSSHSGLPWKPELGWEVRLWIKDVLSVGVDSDYRSLVVGRSSSLLHSPAARQDPFSDVYVVLK